MNTSDVDGGTVAEYTDAEAEEETAESQYRHEEWRKCGVEACEDDGDEVEYSMKNDEDEDEIGCEDEDEYLLYEGNGFYDGDGRDEQDLDEDDKEGGEYQHEVGFGNEWEELQECSSGYIDPLRSGANSESFIERKEMERAGSDERVPGVEGGKGITSATEGSSNFRVGLRYVLKNLPFCSDIY